MEVILTIFCLPDTLGREEQIVLAHPCPAYAVVLLLPDDQVGRGLTGIDGCCCRRHQDFRCRPGISLGKLETEANDEPAGKDGTLSADQRQASSRGNVCQTFHKRTLVMGCAWGGCGEREACFTVPPEDFFDSVTLRNWRFGSGVHRICETPWLPSCDFPFFHTRCPAHNGVLHYGRCEKAWPSGRQGRCRHHLGPQ